jgi:uncharacterized membrane protein YdbT with pleckstrin-like domain
MPYPKRLINDGEEVAFDLRPHWWFFSKQILVGVPLFILLVLITTGLNGDARKYTFWIWGLGALVFAVWLGLKYLDWQFTYFVVTSDRVIFRTGVLSKRGVEIPLERINNINFHQGIWVRIIGAGVLEVQSAGEEGTSMFSDVRHPDGVQQEIYRQMEGDAKRDAGRGADAIGKAVADAMGKGGRGDDIPGQIEKLKKLRDDGAISDAEFEKKKADLLERM